MGLLVSDSFNDKSRKPEASVVLAFAASLVLMLLGQYLLGPPNVHSARALVMAVEGGILISWLLSGPQAYLFQSLRLFRWFVFFWMSVGFAGVLIASHSWASAFVGQIEWLTHLLTLVAIADYIRRGLVGLSSLLMGLVLAAAIILCFFAYRWLLLEDPRNHNWVWDAQPFLNIRHFPFIMLPAYVASLYFCTVKVGCWRSVSFISSVVFLAALFWGGGRGSIGTALIASIFVLGYNIYTSRDTRTALLFYSVLLVVLAYLLSLLVATNAPQMGLLRLGAIESSASADQLASGRLTIWHHVYAHMGPVQWLIGDGVDNYRFLPGRTDWTVHPHSWFFQSLSAWGLPVAAGLFFGAWFIVFRLFWKLGDIKKSGDKADIYFVAVFLMSLLILSVVDGNFYHSWATYIAVPFFAYGLCVLAGQARNPHVPASDNQPGWILYTSSFILVLTIIQLINVSTVFGSKVPSPDDWKSSLVMVLPYNTITVENWLEPWQRQSPEDAFHLLRWLQENSPNGYRFMLIEAEILAGAGREEAAQKKYEEAVNSAPKLTRAEIIETGPPVVSED